MMSFSDKRVGPGGLEGIKGGGGWEACAGTFPVDL